MGSSFLTDLEAYYRFSKAAWTGAADEVEDSSGKGNHGVAVNGVTTIAGGKLGRGGDFDGTNDYIDCGGTSAFNFGTGDFTVAAWINTSQVGNARIVSKRGAVTPYWLIQTASGKARFHIHDGVNQAQINSDITVNDGNDHIIMGVRDNGLVWIYVDGAGKFIVDTTAGNSLDNAVAVTISEDAGLGPFNGLIDEVLIWSRVLSEDEIFILANPPLGSIIPVSSELDNFARIARPQFAELVGVKGAFRNDL